MHDDCLEDVGDANTVYAMKAVKPAKSFHSRTTNPWCMCTNGVRYRCFINYYE